MMWPFIDFWYKNQLAILYDHTNLTLLFLLYEAGGCGVGKAFSVEKMKFQSNGSFAIIDLADHYFLRSR